MALCLLMSPVCFSVIWADELPKESVLPLGLANKAIQAALDTCTKDGYRVSVSVVDRDGVLRAMGRADGAGPRWSTAAEESLYRCQPTASTVSLPISLPKRIPTLQALREINGEVLVLGGGLPIEMGRGGWWHRGWWSARHPAG